MILIRLESDLSADSESDQTEIENKLSLVTRHKSQQEKYSANNSKQYSNFVLLE